MNSEDLAEIDASLRTPGSRSPGESQPKPGCKSGAALALSAVQYQNAERQT